MGLLAGVSVSLAALGLYGVLAYAVERRGRELSIRVTLGATPAGLRGRIVREGLIVASIGIGLGIGAALLGATWLEQLLYDVPPRAPTTYAATAGLFLAVAAIASFVPARRATRFDPVELLRTE